MPGRLNLNNSLLTLSVFIHLFLYEIIKTQLSFDLSAADMPDSSDE